MTPAQAAALAALRPDKAEAWLIVYEDGTAAVMRDDTRSSNHASGAHAVRVPLVPANPAPIPQPAAEPSAARCSIPAGGART